LLSIFAVTCVLHTGTHKVTACTKFLSAGVSATAIGTGNSHTCVVVTGGGLMCWGYNYDGQLGIGSNWEQYSPVAVNLGPGTLAMRVRALIWHCVSPPPPPRSLSVSSGSLSLQALARSM
jgi:hypothetical protein